MALQELPLLFSGGIASVDSHNRLWLMGGEADSAFADVFDNGVFLGRLGIPCRIFVGMWSVAGQWLAVQCEPDDSNFDGDAVTKLFRIVG
jgi:hypothetical protein